MSNTETLPESEIIGKDGLVKRTLQEEVSTSESHGKAVLPSSVSGHSGSYDARGKKSISKDSGKGQVKKQDSKKQVSGNGKKK